MVSDLSRSEVSNDMKELVFGAFDANWKGGEDPNNFGNPVFGHDKNLPFPYVDEYLGWLSCLYLTHPAMKEGQDWVEKDLHPKMAVYSDSGKNASSCEIILCSILVTITIRYTVFQLKNCMSDWMLSSCFASVVN